MVRKLAVASVSYAACQPYRLLADLPFVVFEENDPVENRRRLHEREVDIALIAASEFAIHGGYVGLDFGFGCHQQSSLLLCANEPIQHLDTIYLYEGSSCSAYLLRVLLREQWRISPRLIRVPHEIVANDLRPHEGVLLRADATNAVVQTYPVRRDLVTEWHALTGTPFVFLMWAMRPGVLTLKQHQLFNAACHQAAAVRGVLSAPLPTDLGPKEQLYAKFVRERHFFYLDEHELGGFEEFCVRSNRQKLLPLTEYRSATFTLLDRKPTDEVKLRGVSELLHDVVTGRRLSVREGIRLARRATLPDLGLAADLLRQRSGAEARLAKVFAPTVEELRRYAAGDLGFKERFATVHSLGPTHVRLPWLADTRMSLQDYERLIARLRAECELPIEGGSVGEIRWLAATEGRSLEEVITRLLTAGLNSIRSDGGGMLLERFLRRHHPRVGFTAVDWINTVKWVHRYGGRSACSLTLSTLESWEDRLIHLHKVRSLQDENPGFAAFAFRFATARSRTLDVETKLRGILLGRLFMDNVPIVRAADREIGAIGGLLGLSLGATDLEVDLKTREIETLPARLRTIAALEGVGLRFATESVGLRMPPAPIH
jgi:2-iminoacetate synthase ThiH/predicted solute-binding protein